MLACSLLFLFLLLFFPEIAIQGSKYGASLWLNELLPALLPFFICLRLFQCCLPKFSSHRAFLLLGLLCGYPAGAALVAEQYDRGLLDRRKAGFYLGFVNNPSPMFIIAFCCVGILKMSVFHAFCFFALIVLSGFLGSMLFSLLLLPLLGKKSSVDTAKVHTRTEHDGQLSLSQKIDAIILDSFVVITKIGGYVILFSILGQFISRVLSTSSISGILCIGSIEITCGISYLQAAALSLTTKKVLTAILLAFGGLSAAAQTSSVMTQSGLSIFPYVCNKILNAVLAGFFVFLFTRFF